MSLSLRERLATGKLQISIFFHTAKPLPERIVYNLVCLYFNLLLFNLHFHLFVLFHVLFCYIMSLIRSFCFFLNYHNFLWYCFIDIGNFSPHMMSYIWYYHQMMLHHAMECLKMNTRSPEWNIFAEKVFAVLYINLEILVIFFYVILPINIFITFSCLIHLSLHFY